MGIAQLAASLSNVFWRWAERLAWAGALAMLIGWAVIRLSGGIGAQLALREFATAQAQRQPGAPDQRLWSAKRVSAWRDTLSVPEPAPLAILRLPRIGLEVAVL